MIRALGLVLHPGRDCKPAMQTITDWASAHDVAVLGLHGEIGRIGGSATAVEPGQLAERSGVVISLGGDGTMLRSMRLVYGHETPVLGVNLGRLGFLAEIDVGELAGALTAINDRHFTVEARSGVRARFNGTEVTAFNDVVLVRVPGRGGTAAVEVRVEGHSFVRYAGDAVVVATPTGSTAYSFSAGGPIVSPRAEGLLVVPVAPHSAFNRALFLSGGESLSLKTLPTSGELAVEADGQVVGQVDPADVVDLQLLPAAARVIRLGRTTFYQRAQRRLRLTGSVEADAD
ncbi:MAG: ATP-NAD/AcoX kinase [Pseudonocardia sp.]|jgi:NAD+ kinase|nr:ATP-NAD/AcoX kinase [Pseudonocardia sp.]